ncbi:MAG: hypothetical protein R3220_07375, partial [Balneolaceae bacterium]|nr:hypothetical protein [Balneolaceae bacterium]
PEIPTSSGLGIDLGVLINPLPKLRIGVSIQDLLASYRFNTSDLYGTDSSGKQQLFPVRILAGVSYELRSEWIVSLDFENRRQSFEFLPDAGDEPAIETRSINREETTSTSNFMRAGTSYQLHERFTLRGGIQLNDVAEQNDFQPSVGFSLHLPYDTLSPSIDYAFIREPSGLSTMHVFAIRLNL